MARLFVSYRREDSAGHAGRLADALERAFGADSVFHDVDDIAPGAEFARVIEAGLTDVVAVLVVIGPGWLQAAGKGGRRLDEADDFVRREIELALAADKPLLPVLVGAAAMPAATDLPPSIRALAQRQAIALRDTTWADDFARLRAALAPLLAVGGAENARVRRLVALALAGVLLASGGLLWWRWQARAPVQDDAAFAGKWQARVTYGWGDSHDERFELTVQAGEVIGQASFLGVARTIVAGRVTGQRIDFETRSMEVVGSDPPHELQHHYRGLLAPADARGEGATMNMTLDIRGSTYPSPPVSFIARRAGQ